MLTAKQWDIPYENSPWFYYSKSIVTMTFWCIDYNLYSTVLLQIPQLNGVSVAT